VTLFILPIFILTYGYHYQIQTEKYLQTIKNNIFFDINILSSKSYRVLKKEKIINLRIFNAN